MLEEGTVSAEDIDKAMNLGTHSPIGPLALTDLIGIDVPVRVPDAMWQAYRDPRSASTWRVLRIVEAGLLGRKAGRGFYSYAT